LWVRFLPGLPEINAVFPGGVLTVKKECSLAEKKVVHQQPNRITLFMRETVGELRKVNWPTRQEAINLTTIVLIVIFIMAMFLGNAGYSLCSPLCAVVECIVRIGMKRQIHNRLLSDRCLPEDEEKTA
jgi:preprotein translocase SecE subunit